MSRQIHYCGENHLHYLTANNYCRAHIFDSDRFKLKPVLSAAKGFTQTLGNLRAERGFGIIGYVLMPEHCHLPIWPSDLANPSQIMQALSERSANFIPRTLRHNSAFLWCRRMLSRFELPPTVATT